MDSNNKNNNLNTLGSINIYVHGENEQSYYTLYLWSLIPKYFLDSFILDNPIGNKVLLFKKRKNKQDSNLLSMGISPDDLKKSGLALPEDYGTIIAGPEILNYLKTGIVFSSRSAYFKSLLIETIAVTPKKQSTHTTMYMVDLKLQQECDKLFSFRKFGEKKKETIIRDEYSITIPEMSGNASVKVPLRIRKIVYDIFRIVSDAKPVLLNPLTYVHPERVVETPYYSFISRDNLSTMLSKIERIYNKEHGEHEKERVKDFTLRQYIYDYEENKVMEISKMFNTFGYYEKRFDKAPEFKTLLENEALIEINEKEKFKSFEELNKHYIKNHIF